MYLPLTTKNVDATHANPTQNSTQNSTRNSTRNSTLQILILGGNGFIGSSLAAKLLSIESYNVTILNRGRYYFDSKSRIDPYVRRMVCDRGDIYNCTELVNSTQYYDAVVDYSSYYMEDMQVYIKFVNCPIYSFYTRVNVALLACCGAAHARRL
jgi:hypothetical protein